MTDITLVIPGFVFFFGTLSDSFLQSLLVTLIVITAAVQMERLTLDVGSEPNVSANALWRLVSSKWS